MSLLTLELRERPRHRIDLGDLTPERLEGLSVAKIAALPLHLGRRKVELGELFQLRGDDAATLIIRNGGDRLDRVGAQMRLGRIVVEGDCGVYAGRSMQGGILHVQGRAGRYAGAGMIDGLLHIDGGAEDFVGAAPPGELQGMRGGVILVRGDCGDRLGDRLRRGLILVEGDVGSYCASRMIAGTIAVLGRAGQSTGYGMRRGSLLLTRAPRSVPVTFNDAGRHELRFLALLLHELRGLQTRFNDRDWVSRGYRARRLIGDLGCNGRGEILVLD